MKVPPLDPSREYQEVKTEIDTRLSKIFESGRFILGSEVKEFEEKFSSWIGVRRSIGVASGTDALILSLKALGIGAGDEVITSTFTYFATVEAIVSVGAIPRLVDIDPETFQINGDLIESVVTEKTKAIVVVHLFGQCVDMDAIDLVAARNNLLVIEDVAQAHGATWDGKKAGSLGSAGCFSFYPTKNLGAAGDAGVVTLDSEEVEEKLLSIRAHGASPDDKYFHQSFGMNSRLDEIQAAVLNAKLGKLDSWIEARQRIAETYTAAFQEKADWIIPPSIISKSNHVYHQYVIRTDQRDNLAHHLKDVGVASSIYYKYPMHTLPPLEAYGYKRGQFEAAEKASSEVLALPCFPQMTLDEVNTVIDAVVSFASKLAR